MPTPLPEAGGSVLEKTVNSHPVLLGLRLILWGLCLLSLASVPTTGLIQYVAT
jgi:hypothetical protein